MENHNEECFELNENELDEVVGGYNSDVVEKLNLKLLTRLGTTETRLSFRFCSKHGVKTIPMNQDQLGKMIKQGGYDSISALDVDGKFLLLSPSDLTALMK